ncbi:MULTISPECIES: aminotransferase class I/II-fold pyridoxal phosphate-dependent enzyme [unclassified Streptomyces]|uniref:pyridoxal phosphate-dependent decarboxylase family protein n=1 Tax=unclassified Streptomyces TaxID=2593676 RepID=UPI0024743C22|nr:MULTISPECIES: aminotransferase class I/II-fold pyridoxal phosphate-dependent enzyme [unclassified Streptomyces]MDH6447615.1 glutamate/tyrosine decarboxylase-like PLP-dependent enzyme [Streptomyces sp. SAI-119]MDH6501662.1 glutamate/tyrosine decarboxylase-like PLP-dependent enzyme [Streptomyces sp. SAI-149]
MDLQHWLGRATEAIQEWADGFGPYRPHASLAVDDERFAAAFHEFTGRLGDNYPFFHPRYAGQMLKPPHPAAVVGYLTAMLINPNNHALDGGPATARMEREVVAQLAAMFGYDTHLGHLTTSGTIANLEALFVARELHPGQGVAHSADAHYTHGRMCHVLGMRGHPVPTDERGRMRLDALEDVLRGGEVGTVVLTTGTTGLGAVDPVHQALDLRERYGVRLHVDAAYGGFFTLLAGADGPEGIPAEPWRAVARCDSVVIDPHKHGLQPYGCGAVLFRDPEVGRFYLHDSPYTYFTSSELHLGEISLECSRAGAAAAALWLTFQLLPPTPAGLGRVLAAGRRAALRWSDLITASEVLELYQRPELDIVSYFPQVEPATLSGVDTASARVLADGMDSADPVFLSTLRADHEAFTARHPKLTADADGARILRSVLMKPESEHHVEHVHSRVEQLARTQSRGSSPARLLRSQ